MSKNAKIERADHSWSPWFGGHLSQAWRNPMAWNQAAENQGERRTVRVPLSDWLDPEVPVEWLAKFLGLIHATPNIRWLLLTKRPENWAGRIVAAAESMTKAWPDGTGPFEMLARWAKDGHAPRNVWVGTSVEDQTRADERIPALLRIPAAGRFVCLDPLVGPVDIQNWIIGQHWGHSKRVPKPPCGIHWIIISGDSGPSASPCNVDWIRSLVGQCKAAGVPCWVERLGAVATEEMFEHAPDCDDADCALNGGVGDCAGSVTQFRLNFTNPTGSDPAEWPEDLRLREKPEGLR